ncbi:MAG: hypothetical protein QOG04_319 [Actinomycetota bacterium]|jgi:hypothetical protein|nr:hypothetical protein [Actinomycetota bacterium]
MSRIQRIAILSILLLVVTGVVGACANDVGSSADMGATGSTGENAVDEPMLAPASRPEHAAANTVSYDTGTGTSGSGGGIAGSLAQAPDVGPSVIKTASVDLQVERDGLQEATRDAIAIAGRLGGFVLSTSTSDDRHASSTVVVRVPALGFERALAQLEELGDVKGEQISGEDVGQQFVDLEARLRNLEAQETVMLRLMGESSSVSDSIRVQHELDGIQLEIERLTGRLRYLKDQTDMGTISISFLEVGAPVPNPPSGVLADAWQRAVDLALGVVAALIVGTGIVVPLAILVALAFLGFRAVRPRLTSSS